MKALFFFPATGYYNRAISNPLGLLAIGSFLKQNGHEVKILDRNIEKVNLKKEIRAFAPDIVGVSVMSSRGVKDAVKISHAAKAYGVPVVWGGQMPSMQPEMALSCPDVDLVSYGEGEFTWLELLNTMRDGGDIRNVPGILYAEAGELRAAPPRPFADLAEAAVLDFTLLKTEKYLQRYLGCKRMVYLYSAKGCPGRCAFCSNTNFHKSTFRKRPTEFVVREIRYLVEHYNVDGIYFSDELWCLKKADLIEFCEALDANDLHVHWGIQLRVGMFSEEEFRFLYDHGCRWIFFGIETGNPEMQKRIHKNLNFDKVRETFRATDKIGITTVASVIIGYPDETEEQVRDTVRLINSIRASMVPVFHFTPLPGTELFDEVVSDGRYRPPRTLKELSKVVATESLGVNLSKIPNRDLRVIRCWYNWRAFTDKQSVKSDKKFEFAIDTIKSGLHSISMKGVIGFFVNGFAALGEFVYTFFYAHAFPGMIRKYELNIENK